MGQRLTVTINFLGQDLAKIYYHWSAYTYSALLETKKIIDCIYNHTDETERELQLRLIRFCENNGGGIRGSENAEEHKYIQNLFPNETFKTESYSRNEGLIALSEKGMADLQSWSEGDVYINIDEDQVRFCVYSGYKDLDEYIRERKSWDDEFDETELGNIPEFDFCLGYFDVSNIDSIADAIYNTNAHIIKCNGEICELTD